ncbi:hypothetical protein like AT5G01130 [Hibiscus trionum]|uniref:DUF674 domain-containing protein n=1 Tax=Hibiscus trionum TaxID=183268 RepID=A0A9W7HP96_HIBTR|nr:hypothetical protein like AT5G01130 [Hibiscus trionum]
MASPTTSFCLKLVIDSKSQKVLYAQAGKDFVDFLFNILSLPVGTMMKLVTTKQMVGCVANLFGSIGILGSPFKHSAAYNDIDALQLLFPNKPSSTNIYRCSKLQNGNCRTYKTDDPEELCLYCNNVMNQNVAWDSGVTCMIMDDLKVRPMSSISRTALLNKFNVQVPEEKVIEMGVSQGIKLLSASLQSKTVLTDVFLNQMAMKKGSE